MKTFSIVKIGYTAGIYGCSGEYFKLYITNGDKYKSYIFEGIYTNGQYIEPFLKELGYSEQYQSQPYSQLKRKDIKGWNIFLENELLKKLKTDIDVLNSNNS